MKIESKKINAITVGLSCLAIMIFNIQVNPLQEAWALSRPNITPPNNFNNIIFTKFVPNGSGASPTQYLAVGNFTTQSQSNAVINVYNSNSTTLIGSISYASSLGTLSGYSFDNISCDKTGGSQLCALAFNGASASSVILLIDVGKQTVSTNATRFTVASNVVPIVSLFNDGVQTHIYTEFDDGAQTHVLKLAINTTQALNLATNRIVQQVNTVSNVRVVGIGNEETAIVNNGAGAGQWIGYMNAGSFQLWQVAGASRTCGVNLAGGGNSGDIDYVNDATGSYFLASNQITNLYKIDFGCNLVTTSTFGATQIGTGIWSITHNSGRQEVYIVGSNNLIQVVSETTLSTTSLAQYGSVVSPAVHFNNMATDNAYYAGSFQLNNPFLMLGGSGHPATIFVFFWNLASGTGGGGNGGGVGCPPSTPNCGDINCNLPANSGLLLCQPNAPLVGASQTVGQGVNNLLVGSGLINSTNTNIKTNGVGYIIVAVALGVLISMFWLASGGDLNKIPTFVWFIATLAVLGLSVSAGFVDVTFFIIGAIAVIALASAKIISTLDLGRF